MYGLSHSVEDYGPGVNSDTVTTMQFDCAVMTNLLDYTYERDIEEDYKSSDPLFYRSLLEPLGNWLVGLHRKMKIALQVAENGKITTLHNSNTNETIGIGGAYFHALDHLLELAADTTSDVSPVEVMWEIYSWLNENKAKNPNSLPYVLDVNFWPKITPEVTLAVMDGSAPVMTEMSGFSEDDAESDTEIEARVSPEIQIHPLASGGDLVEDKEMLARSESNSSLSSSIPSLFSPTHSPTVYQRTHLHEQVRQLAFDALEQGAVQRYSRNTFTADICDNA